MPANRFFFAVPYSDLGHDRLSSPGIVDGDGSVSIHSRLCLQHLTSVHRRFDAILSTYDQLGDLVLFTLRAELRCRVMHYCEMSMSKVGTLSPHCRRLTDIPSHLGQLPHRERSR